MTGAQFGTFILGLIVAAIVVAIVVWLLHWLYLRSSKERAFVRTGLGGQKVVLDGGALVLPIVHEVIPVNMNTLRLEVARGRDKALITKDRMRVDVIAEFYVRVAAEPSAVAAAAQTLGQRTLEPEQLKELVEGKFVDALRTAAAEMTMEELHEKRGSYVKRVRETVAGDLIKNGLELESASLTQLDQTAMEFFNPSNAFDAEGLTRLTEQIEHRKKQRNDVEQDTLIAIRNKNLEAEKLSLDIDRESEYARLTQQREVEVARARQRAEVATERAQREQDSEQAQITAKQTIEAARIRSDLSVEQERIQKERAVQAAEVARRQALELAEQQRAIAVARESKAQSEAQTLAEEARALTVSAEEKVFTAREVEMAERKKAIDLIGAAQAAEREVAAAHVGGQGREAGQRRPRRGDPRAGRGRCRRRQDQVAGHQGARRDRGRRDAPDERGAERAVAGGQGVGAAPGAGGQGRGDHPRGGAADGAHRGHQDPARRWSGRRRRRWRRRQQRRLRRQRRQLGAAFSRAGADRRPVAARDRPGVGRHPAADGRRVGHRRVAAGVPGADDQGIGAQT